MINSHADLVKRLESIDFGKPVYKLDVSPTCIQFRAPDFTGKDSLDKANWLESIISYRISRSFDKETKTLGLKADSLLQINADICSELAATLSRCSDAKEVTRTALWKEYKSIHGKHAQNPEYLSDIIGILNYYNASRTDTTCKSNIIGLLQILRKKYGTASNRSAGS